MAHEVQRRSVIAAVLIACLLACNLVFGRSLFGPALAQAPVLSVEDIATPTPTYEMVLWPTVTPAAGTPEPTVREDTQAVSGVGYIVQPGDTLWTVALEVGVDLEEAPCLVSPLFGPEQPLVIGDQLGTLPLGGRCHRVQDGESLSSIAATYAVDAAQIRSVAWNQLPMDLANGEPLSVGRYVQVPGNSGPATGGFMAFMLDQPVTVSPFMAYAVGGPRIAATQAAVPDQWPYGSGRFAWPVYGWMSQGYREDHKALDIAASPGTFVTAADRGVVIRAGWNDQGYGNFVVIDHQIDYMTLYSHLSDILVAEGEVVGQGQVIGTVGSTGNSTGAHLHFEIRDFGRRTNPLELLLR